MPSKFTDKNSNHLCLPLLQTKQYAKNTSIRLRDKTNRNRGY